MSSIATEHTRTRGRRSAPAKATASPVVKKRRLCVNLSERAYEKLILHALKMDKDPCEIVEEHIHMHLRQWAVRYVGEKGQEGSPEDSADGEESPVETLTTGEDVHPSPSSQVDMETGEGEGRPQKEPLFRPRRQRAAASI